MKRSFFLCALCVIFVFILVGIDKVYAIDYDYIEFIYNGRIFTYSLEQNIKTSTQFDINYELNKYNRFGSKQERQQLLQKMLAAGIGKDVAIEYLFPNIQKTLDNIADNIYIKPHDAALKTNTNTEKVFFVTKEIIGVKLDENELYNILCSTYLADKELKIDLPTSKLYPKVTSKDFDYISKRADFSTNIANSSSDRKHNIKNALNSLNMVEVAPNAIFSFNKTVGKRTAQNGYRQAKIIVNNEYVDGLGGGVCQVSTTLYNSALLAGMDIVEANKHSKQIGYVKYGFDAMVNFGSSDLKFKNPTENKIIIVTNYSPSTARIRIFGKDMGNVSYKLVNEIVSVTEPVDEIKIDTNQTYKDKVLYEDEYFYLKKPAKGMEVKSYRLKFVNGTQVSKDLLRFDKFKVQNGVKIYGSKKHEEIFPNYDDFSLTGLMSDTYFPIFSAAL